LLPTPVVKPLLLIVAWVIGVGCTHARPDDMSAQAHRSEAAREERAAQSEAAQYNPSAEATAGLV
jgi:hypothetical protein